MEIRPPRTEAESCRRSPQYALRRRRSATRVHGKCRTATGGGQSSPSPLLRKVRELRQLVPGGRDMPADRLLMCTADYISQLKLRVRLLKTLTELYMP